MKDNKAGGIDGVLNECIKLTLEHSNIASVLPKLFNSMVHTNKLTSCWTTAVVINLFKDKGEAKDHSNCKGSKMTPNISKLYTKLFSERAQR